MGKLAERYGDAARSGVYRVRDGHIPRVAAGEANALLVEMRAARIAESWPRVEEAIGADRTRACVVLVSDAAALAQPEHRSALERLDAAARSCRTGNRPFFAVLVDPQAHLALPLLYHEDAAE